MSKPNRYSRRRHSISFLEGPFYEFDAPLSKHNSCVFLTELQIEREKADLSIQVITLSERLEEAEGGCESQVN